MKLRLPLRAALAALIGAQGLAWLATAPSLAADVAAEPANRWLLKPAQQTTATTAQSKASEDAGPYYRLDVPLQVLSHPQLTHVKRL